MTDQQNSIDPTDIVLDASIVVPMYEEQDNAQLLYQAVVDAMGDSCAWELLFVEDGSKDNTLKVLTEIAHGDERVRVIALAQNFGQTPAMVAGIDYARGRVIVTMDGDLQNDPKDIPSFLKEIDLGFDIVVGYRVKRKDALIVRKIPSWIANRLIGMVTGIRIRDNGCSLKAYRANVIKHIPLYSEMHRFIPAMTSMAGSKIKQIPVRHHARIHGESKYGLQRVWKVLLDLMVVRTLLSSLGTPLRHFGFLSIPPFLFSFILGIGYILSVSAQQSSVVFLGTSILWGSLGLFLLCWGILAELIYSTNEHKEGYLAQLTREIHD